MKAHRGAFFIYNSLETYFVEVNFPILAHHFDVTDSLVDNRKLLHDFWRQHVILRNDENILSSDAFAEVLYYELSILKEHRVLRNPQLERISFLSEVVESSAADKY